MAPKVSQKTSLVQTHTTISKQRLASSRLEVGRQGVERCLGRERVERLGDQRAGDLEGGLAELWRVEVPGSFGKRGPNPFAKVVASEEPCVDGELHEARAALRLIRVGRGVEQRQERHLERDG